MVHQIAFVLAMQTHITEKSPSLTKHLTALSQNYDSKHTVYILKDHNNNTASAFSAIHINADAPPEVPAYERIKGFLDICTEHQLPYEPSFPCE
jgi:hypothetical protein